MEKLICNCKDEDGKPDSSQHETHVDHNNETVLECKKCLRFLKFAPDVVVKTKKAKKS